MKLFSRRILCFSLKKGGRERRFHMKLNLGRFWSYFSVVHKALLRHICTGAIVFVTVIIIPDDSDNQVKKTAHQRPAGSHPFCSYTLQRTPFGR